MITINLKSAKFQKLNPTPNVRWVAEVLYLRKQSLGTAFSERISEMRMRIIVGDHTSGFSNDTLILLQFFHDLPTSGIQHKIIPMTKPLLHCIDFVLHCK